MPMPRVTYLRNLACQQHTQWPSTGWTCYAGLAAFKATNISEYLNQHFHS